MRVIAHSNRRPGPTQSRSDTHKGPEISCGLYSRTMVSTLNQVRPSTSAHTFVPATARISLWQLPQSRVVFHLRISGRHLMASTSASFVIFCSVSSSPPCCIYPISHLLWSSTPPLILNFHDTLLSRPTGKSVTAHHIPKSRNTDATLTLPVNPKDMILPLSLLSLETTSGVVDSGVDAQAIRVFNSKHTL